MPPPKGIRSHALQRQTQVKKKKKKKMKKNPKLPRQHAIHQAQDDLAQKITNPKSSIVAQFNDEAADYEVSTLFNAKTGQCPTGYIVKATSDDNNQSQKIICKSTDPMGAKVAQKQFRDSQAATIKIGTTFQQIVVDFEKNLHIAMNDRFFKLALEGNPLNRAIFEEEVEKMKMLISIIADSIQHCSKVANENRTGNWQNDYVGTIVAGCGKFDVMTYNTAIGLFHAQVSVMQDMIERLKRGERLPIITRKAQRRLQKKIEEQGTWGSWFKRIWATLKAAFALLLRSLKPLAVVGGVAMLAIGAFYGLPVFVPELMGTLSMSNLSLGACLGSAGKYLCMAGSQLSKINHLLAFIVVKWPKYSDIISSLVTQCGFEKAENQEQFYDRFGVRVVGEGIGGIIFSIGGWIIRHLGSILSFLCGGSITKLGKKIASDVATDVKTKSISPKYQADTPHKPNMTTVMKQEINQNATAALENADSTLGQPKEEVEMLSKVEQKKAILGIKADIDQLVLDIWKAKDQFKKAEHQNEVRKASWSFIRDNYNMEQELEQRMQQYQAKADDLERQKRMKEFELKNAEQRLIEQMEFQETLGQQEKAIKDRKLEVDLEMKQQAEDKRRKEYDQARLQILSGKQKELENIGKKEEVKEEEGSLLSAGAMLVVSGLIYAVGTMAFRMTAKENPLTTDLVISTQSIAPSDFFAENDRLNPTVPDFLVYHRCRSKDKDADACLQHVLDQKNINQVNMIASFRSQYVD